MRIGPHDTASNVLIVAEIGNNHEGDPAVAARLVDEMAAAGADAVKLQVFEADRFVSPLDAERLARMRGFELPPAAVASLAGQARAHGLGFVATPLDLESVARLAPLVDAFKIASGDITFVPLLRAVAATGRPVILSTGASTLDEIRRALAVLREGGAADLAVLHCVSAYPAPADEAGLRAIPFLADALGVTVGYSDHVLGLDACVAAAALGARILEKHVTLDRQFSAYRDHQISLEPDEVRTLAQRVRAVSKMLGGAGKAVQPCEEPMRTAIRRSIAAARDLPAGHRIGVADLTWFRPGTGLAPGDESSLVGRVLGRAVRAGAPITREDLAG